MMKSMIMMNGDDDEGDEDDYDDGDYEMNGDSEDEDDTNWCECIHVIGVPGVDEDEARDPAHWTPSSKTVLLQLAIGHHLKCNAFVTSLCYTATSMHKI